MQELKQLIHIWCSEIDSMTSLVYDSFGNLPDEILTHRVNENSWSIAENLKHLIIVNSSYFPVLDALLAEKYHSGPGGFKKWFAEIMGRWILHKVSRRRENKMKTFSIWEPQHFQGDGIILPHFADHQEKLKTYIKSSLPLLEAGCIITSPASKLIFYLLEDAFRIILEHEWRHVGQAREISEMRQGNFGF